MIYSKLYKHKNLLTCPSGNMGLYALSQFTLHKICDLAESLSQASGSLKFLIIQP